MKNIKVSLKRIAEDQIQKAGEGESELDLDLNEDEIDEFTISSEKSQTNSLSSPVPRSTPWEEVKSPSKLNGQK